MALELDASHVIGAADPSHDAGPRIVIGTLPGAQHRRRNAPRERERAALLMA